jgi:hypothetical protein
VFQWWVWGRPGKVVGGPRVYHRSECQHDAAAHDMFVEALEAVGSRRALLVLASLAADHRCSEK